MKISIIVPCYNEQERFADGFNHYYSFLKKSDFNWELIFVNDGSKDDTLSLIKKSLKKNSRIKCVSYAANRGKGYAIVQGVKKASGDFILFTDIDHSVSIKTLSGFLTFFKEGFDVVIGSRRVTGSRFIKRQKPLREFLGKGFTLLVRIFIDWEVKDATCGFKAFRKSAAKKIFNKLSVYNWVFDAEILFLCSKYKIKYAQAPVAWKDAKGSKVSFYKDITGSLTGLIKIRLNDLQKKYQ